MNCPECGGKTKVNDGQRNGNNRRRRECLDCTYRFSTKEEIIGEEQRDVVRCPVCNGIARSVKMARYENGTIRRRRQCDDCMTRYTAWEKIDRHSMDKYARKMMESHV